MKKSNAIKSIRVLIVEDSQDDAMMLVQKLRANDYKVNYECVQNEVTFRFALDNYTWDIVLTDHSMPDFNSGLALKIVQETTPNLPVIIVSGQMGEEHAVDAMRLGASDYVMKDNLMRLFPAIERELETAKIRRLQLRSVSAMQHLASYDALSGLLNRRGFTQHIEDILKNMGTGHFNHILCYLHLDQFKLLNDICGQSEADKLIKIITKLISSRIPKQNTLARVSADYFAVVLFDFNNDEAFKLMKSLCSAIEMVEFYCKDNNLFRFSMNIGMVPFESNEKSATSLMNIANTACSIASEEGRSRVHAVSKNDIAISLRMDESSWASRINNALSKNLFVLAKQKIQSLKNNDEGEHFEILIRLKEKDTLIFPDLFLPAAVHYNLSSKIDRWVIENTSKWLSGPNVDLDKIHLCSINLTTQSINVDGFSHFIKRTLSEANIPPHKICFEITESSAIINFDNAVDFINDLSELGCRFSLDDFGSGFCSFSYLKKLPVDFVKIDGAFVKDIVTDEIDFAMVKAINDIGQLMGKMTIAEYVETDKATSLLRDLGVDYIQGYVIGKPELIDLD